MRFSISKEPQHSEENGAKTHSRTRGTHTAPKPLTAQTLGIPGQPHGPAGHRPHRGVLQVTRTRTNRGKSLQQHWAHAPFSKQQPQDGQPKLLFMAMAALVLSCSCQERGYDVRAAWRKGGITSISTTFSLKHR